MQQKRIDNLELVGRHEEVAFARFRFPTYPETGGSKWYRMEGFTSLEEVKNAITYDRRYVDEKANRVTGSGFAPSINFNFDRYSHFRIHDEIRHIFDNDVFGSKADVEIVVVDMATAAGNKADGYARMFNVVPDTKGNTTDAMTYSGTFRGNGEVRKITATLDDPDMPLILAAVEDADPTSGT